MSGEDPVHTQDWESEINALLDGELDDAQSEALKNAARNDSVLAQAIVEAWQLHKNMDQLSLEKAPASLSRKLKRIPREQSRVSVGALAGLPRWVTASGLSLVMIIALVVVLKQPGGQPPVATQQAEATPISDSERVEQAQRDLEIAFYYLDKAGMRAGQQINEVLSDELSAPLTGTISKHIPYIGHSRKEKRT